MGAMVDYEIKTRRFTRAEYERLTDLGVFQSGEAIALVTPLGAPGSSIPVSRLLP